MIGIELNKPCGELVQRALAQGLLLRPIGSTLYVMPPYVLTESDQRDLAEGLVQVLDQVLAEIAALPAAVPSTAPGADASRMA